MFAHSAIFDVVNKHRHPRPYSEAEEQLIRQVFPFVPARVIAQKLGRSEDSIYSKARHMGIKASLSHKHFKPSLKFGHLTETELAYIAGIIDGEGWITNKCRGRGFELVLFVGNTDAKLLNWLADKLQLKPERHGRIKSPKHKPLFTLSLSTHHTFKLLNLLIPYLIAKREQAQELCRQYQQYFEETEQAWRKVEEWGTSRMTTSS